MAKASTAARLEQHPLALQLVPGTMPEDEYDAFCADLKKRGQQHDILLFEGKVLDGWHRYTGCEKSGITPKFKEYEGDDPAGMVIALNVLRRKLGTTQRALAAAHLNLEHNLSQDEASKRVGVSKLHTSLVVQALNSKNARIIKLLENPTLTRESLVEQLEEAGIIKHARTAHAAQANISAAGAMVGLPDAFFDNSKAGEDDDDLIGDGAASELDGILDGPPSANGRVLTSKAGEKTAGGMPTVGGRPAHPERRNKETPASVLADRFKGLSEADQVSFVQIAWPTLRKIVKLSGVSMDVGTAAGAVQAAAVAKASASAGKAPAKGKGKATPAKA